MLDAAFATSDIVGIAIDGLGSMPKTLPPKLFYDAEGVKLFDAITKLPEYYLTRTERRLLAMIAGEIVDLASPGSALVEYGASDEGKALALLDALQGRFASYVPIDVAAEALDEMQARMASAQPEFPVHPVCGDFLQPLVLPAAIGDQAPFGFFPGSTIGNLEPELARKFFRTARRTLGPNAWLIVGVDLRKDPEILIPAYDDAQGVTAAFNLNLLHRLNREAAADFVLDQFAHLAIWNDVEGRIEMHLESLVAQTVHIGGTSFAFEAGETIHTENSYKHSIEGFQSLAAEGGWAASKFWTDDAGLFSIHALKATS